MQELNSIRETKVQILWKSHQKMSFRGKEKDLERVQKCWDSLETIN